MSIETVVRERPILFSGPMVRALLGGRKTQTRRVVKGAALEWLAPGMFSPEYVALPENGMCPYGAPGDRLWVRETWGWNTFGGGPIDDEPEQREIVYRASRPTPLGLERWRPSIHMPRAFSRLTLEITDVRVQRVQEISEDDATAEGIEWDAWDQCAVTRNYAEPDSWFQMWDEALPHYAPIERLAIESFRTLWDSLNAARGYGWDTSPWVWALTFRRVEVET